MMPNETIKYTDTLRQGTDKMNSAIENLNKAENDMVAAKSDAAQAKSTASDAKTESAQAKTESSEAKTIADQALSTANSTKLELDTIVINGDSSVEAAQARVDASGISHTTLKDRLDAEQNKVNQQLADTTNELNDRVSNLVVNAITTAAAYRTRSLDTATISTNTEVDNTLKYKDIPTLKMTSSNSEIAELRLSIDRLDLTEYTHFQLRIKKDNNALSLQLSLGTDASNTFTNYEVLRFATTPDKDGWVNLRISKANMQSATVGNPLWSDIKYMRLVFKSVTGATSVLNVADISVSGTENPEILDGRVDSRGTIHPLIGDRIKADLEYVKTNKQFLETTSLPVDRTYYDNTPVLSFNFSHLNNATMSTGVSIDTINKYLGNNTLKFVSDNGVNADYRMTMNDIYENIDYIGFWLKADKYENIAQIQVSVGTDLSNVFTLADITPTLSPDIGGNWRFARIGKADLITITGSPTWSSIKFLRFVVKSKPNTKVTLNLASLSKGVNSKAAIYMYMDDGIDNQYTEGFRIMEKYGLKGTIAVITSVVGDSDRVTWQQLREMHQAGWLVCSHTHTHRPLATLTNEERHYELATSARILKEKGFHLGSRCFVAPFGSWGTQLPPIAKQYYALCRTQSFSNRVDPVSEFPQANPIEQRYISPINTESSATINSWIDNVISKRGSLALAWHGIVADDSTNQYHFSIQKFEEVCAYLKQKVDEGVVIVPTWQDTMLQTLNPQPFDALGKKYNTTYKGQPSILTLPV